MYHTKFLSSLKSKVLLTASLLTVAAHVNAAVVAYETPVDTGAQGFGGPLGMDFDVNSDIVITQLGVFDSGGDGIFGTITAYIYDRNDTATPLATLTFTSGDPGSSISGGGSSLFKTLSVPLSLSAGFQGSIVADGFSNNDRNGNVAQFDPPSTLNDGGGLISFVGTSRFSLTPGTYPTSTDSSVNQYLAGTFVFEAGVIPEPSTYAGLLGLSAAAFIFYRRRQLRK